MPITMTPVSPKQKNTQLSFQEMPLSKQTLELDPLGWVMQSPQPRSDKNGMLIVLKSAEGNPVAAVTLSKADTSQFQSLTRLDKRALTNAVYISSIWVDENAKLREALPAVLYLALRRGRIWGREQVVTLIPVPNANVPIATLLRLERLSNLDNLEVDSKTLMPAAQNLKYSILSVYDQCADQERALIQDNFLGEILEVHSAWLDRFYHGSWAQSILEGTMSKEQYIYSLYNLHQYVRQTTRLCARCVAHSEDLELRNHYIYHFKGEINHELLIERDIKHLGGDLEYMMQRYVPHIGTKEFMLTQESTIGFYQDPVLMLACPMAAEGVAASMKDDFVDALLMLIESWGVKKPKEAARFLTSHIHTDGGEDGHWEHVVTIMKKHIKDEYYLQRFLTVLRCAMNGFEHGFNANVDDMKLWSAKPKQ